MDFFEGDEFAGLAVAAFEDLAGAVLAVCMFSRATVAMLVVEVVHGCTYGGICSLTQLLELLERVWVPLIHDGGGKGSSLLSSSKIMYTNSTRKSRRSFISSSWRRRECAIRRTNVRFWSRSILRVEEDRGWRTDGAENLLQGVVRRVRRRG